VFLHRYFNGIPFENIAESVTEQDDRPFCSLALQKPPLWQIVLHNKNRDPSHYFYKKPFFLPSFA
jgi:hypothetical protein